MPNLICGTLGSVLGNPLRDPTDTQEREQLIDDLAFELEDLVQRNAKHWRSGEGREERDHLMQVIGSAREFTNYGDDEDYSDVIESLVGALNYFAPAYCVFCGQEGGTDYGFKPDLETLEDDAATGDVLKVNDTGDVPFKHRGFVMHVSDHGNVTLYLANGYGKLDEQWGCV